MNVRILFFSHYFPPEGNAPASRTCENCKRWVRAGHQVTVVTCAPNSPNGVVYEGYKNKIYQRETMDGIDVRRVWTYVAANEGTFRRILNYVSYMMSAFACSFFVKRPDVVIATSPQFFCGWAGLLYRWVFRAPFILEIRDIWPESIVAVGAMKKSRLIRLLEWLEMKMYKAADHIVTVGDGYRQKLQEKGVPESKISVVMNGVDANLFQPRLPEQGLKKHWGLQDKFVCGYLGTIGMASGLGVVLEAARKLKENGIDDIGFMLVGDGAMRKQLEQQARASALKNVVFTGRQPKEQMPDYISIADVCLIHLRKSELFTTVMPSKIFEAAGMAKPIINGVAGFAADFVEKAGAGMNIEPENSDELVKSVLYAQSNPDQCSRFGKSGHEHVMTFYNRDQLAKDYLNIIEKLS